MKLFNKFKRSSFDSSDWYEENNDLVKNAYKKEQETIQKSMPKGRSQASTAVSSLDVGVSNESTASKGSMYEHKQLLRNASNNVIVQSIIRTRTNQVVRFARPARYSNDGAGFKILPKNPPKDGQISKTMQNRIYALEEFIKNTGWEMVPQRGGGFRQFLSEFIFNHYVFDQINTELVRDKNDKINHFNMVDGGTVLLKDLPKSVDKPRRFVQYPSGQQSKPIEFNEHNMTFVIFNAHANVNRHGYGFSAVDAALPELGYEMDTEQFNARFFAQGGTTRGLLLIDTGDNAVQQNTSAMNSLRREWQASYSGVNGAWKIPVVSAHDAKFVNMTQSSKDMEFEKWLDYLINNITGLFAMQPDEINFPNRGGGATGRATSGSSLNEGNSQRSRYNQSQNKGLRPLMQFIEDFINTYILREVDDKYYFRFTLGDSKDELQQEQVRNLQLKNGMTLNEIRKQMGLPPLQNGLGDYPGDASIVVQFAQIENREDQISQVMQQGKNEGKPSKADHGKPEEGMTPDNLNSDDKQQQTNDADSNNDTLSDKAKEKA